MKKLDAVEAVVFRAAQGVARLVGWLTAPFFDWLAAPFFDWLAGDQGPFRCAYCRELRPAECWSPFNGGECPECLDTLKRMEAR